jgi:hypothetical protein
VLDTKGELDYFVGNQNPIPAEDVRPFSIAVVLD